MVRSNLTGSFYGKIVVEYIDGNMWKLNQKEYPFGMIVNDEWNILPDHGFCFDFASLPVIVRWLYPKVGSGKTGQYAPAAVIHDWVYSYPGKITRELADRIFLLGMELENVRPTLRALFYAAVRAGGWRYFGKPDKLNKMRSGK